MGRCEEHGWGGWEGGRGGGTMRVSAAKEAALQPPSRCMERWAAAEVVIYYVYTLLFARVATWHYFFSILMLSGISENNKKK